MTIDEALPRMRAPGDKRGDACYGVMQICATTRCDAGKCSNCTQMVPYVQPADMDVANFRAAVDSLSGYPGVVGVFGGNPCLHRQFEALSRYMLQAVPDKARRGLWTNNFAGHGAIIKETYGYFNLNVHGNRRWAAEIRRTLPFVEVWNDQPGCTSKHGAVLVAMADVVPNPADRWELIASCDVNQRWSAAIVEIDGELGGYFCEVAAALARLRGKHVHAVPIEPGWWQQGMDAFQGQARELCMSCGVPLRLAGHDDSAATDDVSASWLHLPVQHGRAYQLVTEPGERARELTDYQRLRS